MAQCVGIEVPKVFNLEEMLAGVFRGHSEAMPHNYVNVTPLYIKLSTKITRSGYKLLPRIG